MNPAFNQPSSAGYQRTRLLGHRGARGEAPENTMAGFAYLQSLSAQTLAAQRMFVAGVEFDVQLSADDQLIVHHDATLLRTCGMPMRVDGLSGARLASIFQSKLARHFTAKQPHQTRKYPLQPISLLADVVTYMTDYTHIELEIKTHAQTDHRQLAKVLVYELSQPRYAQLPITLTSFDTKLLAHLQATPLPFKRGLLTQNTHLTRRPYELVNLAKRLQVDQVGIFEALISQHVVELLHLYRLYVTAWTVNDIERTHELYQWGVDYVITDYPKRLLS